MSRPTEAAALVTTAAARNFAQAFSVTVRTGSCGIATSGASVFTTLNSTPRSRRILARRGEPEASINGFIYLLRNENWQGVL